MVDQWVDCNTSCLRQHRHCCTEACRSYPAVHQCTLALARWVEEAHIRFLDRVRRCNSVVRRIVVGKADSCCCTLAVHLHRASILFRILAFHPLRGGVEKSYSRALVAVVKIEGFASLQAGAEDEGKEEEDNEANEKPATPITPGRRATPIATQSVVVAALEEHVSIVVGEQKGELTIFGAQGYLGR